MFQGEWKPKQIDNPAYKGKWIHPEIDNPEYEADDKLYSYSDFGAIGFDLWQVRNDSKYNDYLNHSFEFMGLLWGIFEILWTGHLVS